MTERLELETSLRWALERGELRIYYQPIIDLVGGEIAGFEALIGGSILSGDCCTQ